MDPLCSNCARRSPRTRKRTLKRYPTHSCSARLELNATTDFHSRLRSIDVHENKTTVRLVAYSKSEQLDFHLPVYLMSRGRWIINDQARAYLLDEKCREYRLNGRKSTEEMPAPRDGIVQLKPNSVFETILEFPPLDDDVKAGVLVYGLHVLPFSMLRGV